MHRRVHKPKYYSVRTEIQRGNVLVMGILFVVTFGINKENFNKDLTMNREQREK